MQLPGGMTAWVTECEPVSARKLRISRTGRDRARAPDHRARVPAAGTEREEPDLAGDFSSERRWTRRLELVPGNTFEIRAAAGGGFGPPHERDPAALRDDIENGYVSTEGLARDYGRRTDEIGS